MLTTDRVAGGALVVLALVVFWESRKLPLGSLRNPGPAYMPVLLAAVLLLFGVLLVIVGGRASWVASVTAAAAPISSPLAGRCGSPPLSRLPRRSI